MNTIQENSWKEFYKTRVNNYKYENYFKERYKPFLDEILKIKPRFILEEGIGIGTLGKVLHKLDFNISALGYNINEEMLELASENLNHIVDLWKDNILQPNGGNYIEILNNSRNFLVTTHGVLEHFSDLEISSIMQRYYIYKLDNIHYVPLDKYSTPSFGDERLLSVDYWLKLVKPKDYKLFNDNHDLILINI